ncbi:Flp pilus assembly protein, secretin CpaC [Paramagnetospirillum caucaseum]|uniref:Flp pilus assembly protein, secretin CpaC n=1 Tax=Paramagnetospirillum caucaseum TaxID=1244869 RepID=M3A839_9PROT|nr:type II and III secretion system protein family protein [Paramagnetospirillum caucaseum]EME68654.1 Flp pilus assembly protein, secretin CpaC [Paramagnetospirillum caucaseum]
MNGRLVLAAVLAILLAAPAWARDEEPPPPQPSPRAKVVSIGAPPEAAQSQRPGTPQVLRLPSSASAESMRVAVGKSIDLPLPAAVKEVVVGNSDIADVMVRAPNLVHITGRAVGQTNVFLMDRSGRVMRRIDLAVSIDSQAVKDALRAVLPDEHAIAAEAVADSLYLSGSVKNDAAARDAKMVARRFVSEDAKLVNLIRVVNEQQVLLHVKVAEIQRTVLKELGVGLTSNKTVPLVGSSKLSSLSTSATVGLFDTASNPLYGTATITGIGALVANLNILENQGLIRTLVEPNLTAVSGETATMLAGGELPIPVSTTNGSISIEFKPYGVLLSFTPVVLDPGRLSLKMSTEVSAIDTNNSTAITSTISVPAFKVRRAGSTVELPSGGSIMIAGLLQNDITANIAGLPGLMDLPVLGALFRSNAFQRNETELVVILSAYVVRPVEQPGSLSTPNDGFAPSSDLKRFLLGRLQDTYTTRSKEAPAAPPALQGPYGHIVQ